MSLADIDHARYIEAAIAEFDRLGRQSFLAHYGFHPARRFFVLRGERLYDSKAIVGVAHRFLPGSDGPLRPADFSGGAQTIERLTALGFTVVTADVASDDLRPAVRHSTVRAEEQAPAPSEGVFPPKAYLLTWNPSRWPWRELLEDIDSMSAGGDDIYWSTGNTRSIPAGSRVYLLKQGPLPRGIMAAGWTTGPVELQEHWDPERARRHETANVVPVHFDVILDPDRDPLLDPADFPPGPAADVYWHPAASGISIPGDAATEVEALWEAHTGGRFGTHEDEELSALEGAERALLMRHRRREGALRDAKIEAALARGPLRCEVPGCGFDFLERYGEIGRAYAHVHHLRPIADGTGPRQTRLSELAIVCANCHAMIHRGGACRPLETLIAPHSRP